MRSLFIKTALFGLVVCAAGQLSAGTVGFWRFEPGATWADSSGNGLTLTRTSTNLKAVDRPASGSGSYLSIIPQTGAENDGVAHLDGQAYRFYVADTNLFDFGSNAFTFETFVTPTTNGYQTVVEKVDEWRMGINQANGKLTLSLYDGVSEWKTAQKIFDGATSFTAGNDYYVAAVVAPGVSNTVVSFYYQNLTAGGDLLSDVKTIAGINSINNSAERLELNGNAVSRSLDYMDEVRLSSGALSQSELLATFPELGYWRFEPGAVTNDSSGNGLDLTQLIAGASTGGADFPKGVDRNESGEGSYLPTIPQSGVTNAGVSYFNAKGNHWAVADTNLFDFGTSAFSFETFVTPTTGIGYQTVAEKDEEWRVSINESKGELTLAVWDASLASNNWVIAQAKLDGTNSFTGSVDYYIGVVATPGASNTAVTLYYQNLTAGGDLLSAKRTIAGVTSIHNTTNSFLLNGDTNQRAVRYMDEVRIVTRALGESELLVAAAADPSGFDAFVDKYDLSGDPSANADNDELTDWGEYVFGGNPTNSGDIGTQPSFDSGDYLFSIVGDNTLQYYVLTNTNLVEGSWGTNTGPVAITDESGELGSYTNAVGTADDELFIKLLVE